jgi:REP element-mobilizing transposase RayT
MRGFHPRPDLYCVTECDWRLPHLHGVGQETFLTCRLRDSLPPGQNFPKVGTGRAFAAVDRVLDQATAGSPHLSRPEIAAIVEKAILQRQEQDYRLHAWVIMPNHVHLLITPWRHISGILQSLKGQTGRACNRALGLTGKPFWQDESYDRLVRDPADFDRMARYIETNPVRAGLVRTPEEYRWSSFGGGRLPDSGPPDLWFSDGGDSVRIAAD